MFKQLLAILKRDDLIAQALQDTENMFQKSARLFTEACRALEHNQQAGFDIYDLDKEINGLEKKIRRKILEHLSINPKQDIVASLVLTSIVISIERIGDHAKNIYELIDLYEKDDEITIDPILKESAAFIETQFSKVQQAFSDGDQETAKTLMHTLDPVRQTVDRYIFEEAAKKENCSARRTIVNVLYARFLKRVAAHLENTASSISNPFDMIGFYKKGNQPIDL